MSRILRSLVCLLLICCILVNLSPLKAQATGAGVVAGGIVKAASVSIPALWPIVATLAVVGITAYGIESGAFENIANSCYSAFESAGTWINNGMAEILRTEDADGNVQYYVDGGMLEDVRSWVYDSSIVSSAIDSFESSSQYSGYLSALEDYCSIFGVSSAYVCFINKNTAKDSLCFAQYPFSVANDGYIYSYSGSTSTTIKVYNSSSVGSPSFTSVAGISSKISYSPTVYDYYFFSSVSPVISAHDVTLGYLPDRDTVLDDETIVTFHPYLADVIRTRTGGSGGSGEDENKWWLAVAYAETLEKLYQTSQQAQIENPSVTEIPDLQEGTQYEVTIETDVDGNERYVLSPIYNSGTGDGTDTGTDTDPDTGTDTGTDTDSGSGDSSGDDTGTDSGTSTDPSGSWTPSGDMQHFTLDLKEYFPFCIPFDLYDFFTCLNADPVAPVIEWVIPLPGGDTYPLELDLSTFDPVAQLLRRLQLLLFCVGLAFKTRDLIKG